MSLAASLLHAPHTLPSVCRASHSHLHACTLHLLYACSWQPIIFIYQHLVRLVLIVLVRLVLIILVVLVLVLVVFVWAMFAAMCVCWLWSL